MEFTRAAYTPTDGLKNATSFPTSPANEAAGRKQIQDVLDQIRDNVNVLEVELESITDSSSGADRIGLTAISGVTGETVQSAMEDLKTQIDNTALGAIADESLTVAKVNDELFFIEQNYKATTNVGNAYSITSGRGLTSLVEGMEFKIKANANSSGNTTLNVDGIGAKNILKASGSNVTNVKSGGIYTVVYNGTAFQLQGEGGEGTAVIADVLTTKTFTNDTGDTLTGTMPNRAGDTACLASSVSGTTLKLRASDGYRDGVDDNVTITDADFIAGNIRTGVDIFGVTGNIIEKKYATGTVSVLSSSGTFTRTSGFADPVTYKLVVSGLTFTPTSIQLVNVGSSSINVVCYNSDTYIANGPIVVSLTGANTWTYKLDGTGNAAVTSTGFVLPAWVAGDYKWQAWA